MYRSLATIKADLAQAEFGVTGRGIVWAVVSTGVKGDHRHFQAFRNLELPEGLPHLDYSGMSWRRLHEDGFDPLDDEYTTAAVDPNGIGTAVAGLIAGESSDGRGRLMRGIAPQATILSVKVLDAEGAGWEYAVTAGLRAIQRLNDHGLKVHGAVLALSLDWDRRNWACGQSPVCVEVDRLVNSGVVVVVPAGDRGHVDQSDMSVEGGITDPGNSELAITVGATHRTAPKLYGASYFSSRGPTADGRRKPDLLAPGEKLTVCWADQDGQADYRRQDGTSYAAAHVAGAAAALLSAEQGLIGKPRDVKSTLMRTAVDLGREVTYQGAGLIDVMSALQAAVGDPAPEKSAKTAQQRVKVFCSYSHRDASLWAEMKAHLSSLERAQVIEVWSDELIEAGDAWEAEIYEHLGTADIVLLLVSAYFVASEFCYSKELKSALERHARGEVKVIPIRGRPVTLAGTPLQQLQALPPKAKPITSFRDPHKAWAEVTDHLYEMAVALREARVSHTA
jgi:serine protease AprX